MSMVLTPAEFDALQLSLKVGVWSLICSLPVALGVAYLLARYEFPGKGLINAAVHLPLVMPPVVTGYLLLLAFGLNGPVGHWLKAAFGIEFAFRWTGAALAAAVMAFPLLVRPIRLSFEAVDRKLEDAAATLGANGFARFLTITLPLALPGILAGAVLGFAKSLGEFGATIIFVSNIPGETQTLSLAIYSFLQSPGGEGSVVRLTLLAIGLSLAALLASEWLARRLGRVVEG
jgi:molybdate transport system permease protein